LPVPTISTRDVTIVENDSCERGILRGVEFLLFGGAFQLKIGGVFFTKSHENAPATRDQPRHVVKELAPHGEYSSRNLLLRFFSENWWKGILGFPNSDPSSQKCAEISSLELMRMHEVS
jgi:hypothetical protein